MNLTNPIPTLHLPYLHLTYLTSISLHVLTSARPTTVCLAALVAWSPCNNNNNNNNNNHNHNNSNIIHNHNDNNHINSKINVLLINQSLLLLHLKPYSYIPVDYVIKYSNRNNILIQRNNWLFK